MKWGPCRILAQSRKDLQRRDKNIYLPCIGWILLDGAVLDPLDLLFHLH